jgi:hypothetical protein
MHFSGREPINFQRAASVAKATDENAASDCGRSG